VSVRSHTIAVLFYGLLLAQGFSASARAGGIGFQARLDVQSTVVSPYFEPEIRFSAAMYPLSYAPLTTRLVYTPRLEEQGNYESGAISFETRIRGDVDLVPVSVDAQQYYARRVEYSVDHSWETFGATTLGRSQQRGGGQGLAIGFDVLPKRFEQMFGEGGAQLRVSGYRRITFSGRSQWDDAAGSGIRKQSKFPALNMEQISRFSIQGTIGTKISVSVSQDNQTDIPLANRLILRYKGDDDDILKTIEAGNTTLSLPNTQFVGYSQRVQGLFGIKTEAQLGNLTLTAIASQEKGSSETATVSAIGEENAQTIRDNQYLEGRIYDLAYPGEIGPSDRVQVWVFEEETDIRNNPTAEKRYLKAGRDPNNQYKIEDLLMSEVSVEKYELLYGQDANRCPVALVFYTARRRTIGVRMEISRYSSDGTPTGKVDTIGYDGTDTKDTLRIIQAPSAEAYNPDHPAWELMWRNCYSIPRNVRIEDIEVKVFKGLPGREQTSSSLDYQKDDAGVAQDPYLKILGLDQWNNNRTDLKVPDGKLDPLDAVFRDDWGLLIFPEREPFNSNRMFTDANGEVTDTLIEKVPNLYVYPSSSDKLSDSKYYIQISTKVRSATIRLGRANVIEGSERVTMDGRPLVKGNDYEISYDMGQVTLLDEAAANPNADVQVEFQYAPFMSLQKKTLLGVRAEYEHSEDLKLGTTVLYKSDKAQDRKPRVGQETAQATVYDFDVSFGLRPNFLSKMIDALPFISTEADSRLRVTAEIAQSRPNPNVEGEAYVDDFESAVELQSLGNVRTSWTPSSEPVPILTSAEVWARGTIRWHNPPAISREEVYIGETVAGQGALQPLRLIFRPHGYKYTGGSAAPCADSLPARSWGGIMRAFANRIDQKRVQLFEVRALGGQGMLHFDFGRISEDINGDGVGQDEDQSDPPNGVLDYDPDKGINEDVGLDLKPDAEETDVCGNGPSARKPDPAGDNWWYEYKGKGVGESNRPPISDSLWNSPGFQARVNDPNDWLHYEWQNGTEGNIDDDAVQGLPDREALLRSLQDANAYFTFTLPLDTTLSNPYLVPETGRNGWHTFRVPIRDPGIVDTVAEGQTPSWSSVTHVRVWFEKDVAGADSLTAMDSVWIADWGFVQSNWRDTLLTAEGDDLSEFYIASVSEESGEFTPPPGVEPYVDKVNNITEMQRGLALVFENLQPGAEGVSRKDLISTEAYSGYRRMEMYVHGDDDLTVFDSLMFYFRLGLDSLNYYEFRTYLQAGWASDNHVVINFDDITALKDEADRALRDRRAPLEDSTQIYRVVGRPNINEIRFLSASVQNHSHTPISGSVWIDELRVTQVRKDVGTAARVTVSGSLADVANYTFNYQHQDAFFRGLSQATRGGSKNNLGSGSESNKLSFSTTFNLSQFLPRSWQARVPVSYSYAQSESIPLLRTNSDVVLPAEVREEEKSTSRSVKISVTESFSRKGGNLLFKAFLNRQRVSFSYTRARQKRINNPMILAESYNVRAEYDMGVSKPPEIPVFFWTKPIPLLKKMQASELAMYPVKWRWSGTFSRSLQAKDDVDLNRTSSFSRLFNGRMDLTYRPFPNLSLDFNMATKRDLTDPDLVRISFRNPKLGLENSYNQSLTLSFDPRIFSFLSHSFRYGATYTDNYERSSTTRTTSLSTNWAVSGDFRHQVLFGSGRKRAGPSRGTPRGTVRGGVRAEDEEAKEAGTPFYEPVLKGLRFLTGWLQPFRYQYAEGFQRSIPGAPGKLPWKYRLGLDNRGEFTVKPTNRNPSAGESMNWEIGSGFSLLGGISTSVGYKTRINRAITTVGTDRTESITTSWPELTLQISRFTTLPLIKKYVNWFVDIFSPRTNYSRQVTEVRNLDRGFTVTRTESINRSPLISFTLKLFQRLSLSGSYGRTLSIEEKSNRATGAPESETRDTKKTLAVSTKYAFSAPTGISIPLFGKLKFKSMVTFDFSVQYASGLVETSKRGLPFVVFTNTSSFSASPVISYTFSTQIRGGLSARWQDTNDAMRHRKSHVREIRIWTEIRF